MPSEDSSEDITHQEEFVAESSEHQQGVCSPENPPRLESGGSQNGYHSVLNLCGEKTNFTARMMEQEDMIVFSTKPWANQTDDQQQYEIRTIATTAPFDTTVVATLSSGVHIDENCQYFEGVFSCREFADGPGFLERVFVYMPKTNNFVYIYNAVQNGRTLEIVSSYSEEKFIYRDKQCYVYCADESQSLPEVMLNGEEFSFDTPEQLPDQISLVGECLHFDLFPIVPSFQNEPAVKINRQQAGQFDIDAFVPKKLTCIGPSFENNGEIMPKETTFNLESNMFVQEQ